MHTIRPAVGDDGLGAPPSDRGFVLVCGDVGRPLGHARVLEADGRFHLMEVLVVPGQRRQGIGSALIAAVEAETISRGATALTLLAEECQTAFFKRLGYQPIDRLPVALRWLAQPLHDAMARPLAPDVVPRPAVSVIPLRDTTHGVEAFVQHRVATMDFAAGAVVFPGGRVDPPDYEMHFSLPSTHAEAWAHTALPSPETLVAASIREVAEECNVLLEPAALVPGDNWVTPSGGRRRFDVAFFVTEVKATDAGRWSNTTTEAVRSRWESVAGLLTAEDEGRIRLMPPTRALLAELAGFATVAEVLAHSPIITTVEDDEPVRPRPPGRQRTS